MLIVKMDYEAKTDTISTLLKINIRILICPRKSFTESATAIMANVPMMTAFNEFSFINSQTQLQNSVYISGLQYMKIEYHIWILLIQHEFQPVHNIL